MVSFDPAREDLRVVTDRLSEARQILDHTDPASPEALDAYRACAELSAEYRDRLRAVTPSPEGPRDRHAWEEPDSRAL